MRDLVVRTAPISVHAPGPRRSTTKHTLSDVEISAREAIRRQEARVHVDAMLSPRQQTERTLTSPPSSPSPTESSTLPRALSSASTLSLRRWSSGSVRWVARPFAIGWVVGPEGTVGA